MRWSLLHSAALPGCAGCWVVRSRRMLPRYANGNLLMSDTKQPRLEDVVIRLYGEQISAYAHGSDGLQKDAVNVCLPAVAALSLPEQYASVVLTSRMDNELRKLLERALHRQGDAHKLLFEYDRPFGSFSAKINAAYGFGFLTRKMYDALTCCRKIRNTYAHSDNPDDAVDSTDYKKNRSKLLGLDAGYAAECAAKFCTLRDNCKGAIPSLPDFSEIVAVMLQVCEMLGLTAFHAHVARSQLLRFPCAYFGPGDAPPLEAISRTS